MKVPRTMPDGLARLDPSRSSWSRPAPRLGSTAQRQDRPLPWPAGLARRALPRVLDRHHRSPLGEVYDGVGICPPRSHGERRVRLGDGVLRDQRLLHPLGGRASMRPGPFPLKTYCSPAMPRGSCRSLLPGPGLRGDRRAIHLLGPPGRPALRGSTASGLVNQLFLVQNLTQTFGLVHAVVEHHQRALLLPPLRALAATVGRRGRPVPGRAWRPVHRRGGPVAAGRLPPGCRANLVLEDGAALRPGDQLVPRGRGRRLPER